LVGLKYLLLIVDLCFCTVLSSLDESCLISDTILLIKGGPEYGVGSKVSEMDMFAVFYALVSSPSVSLITSTRLLLLSSNISSWYTDFTTFLSEICLCWVSSGY
jgi:hypothetical protein